MLVDWPKGRSRKNGDSLQTIEKHLYLSEYIKLNINLRGVYQI